MLQGHCHSLPYLCDSGLQAKAVKLLQCKSQVGPIGKDAACDVPEIAAMCVELLMKPAWQWVQAWPAMMQTLLNNQQRFEETYFAPHKVILVELRSLPVFQGECCLATALHTCFAWTVLGWHRLSIPV